MDIIGNATVFEGNVEDEASSELLHRVQNSVLDPLTPKFHIVSISSAFSNVTWEKDSFADYANLPDIPLLKIFSYLDIKDLNRAALTCSRWYEVSRSPHFWQHIPIKSRRFENLMNYFPVIPDFVTSLRISCVRGKMYSFPSSTFLHYLKEFCSNLDTLRIEHARIMDSRVGHFLAYRNIIRETEDEFPDQFPKDIRELSMEGCSFNMRHLFYRVPETGYIKVLNLTDCLEVNDFSVKLLCGLINLQELYLSRCKISDNGATHLLNNIRRLRVIDLEGCQICDATFMALKQYGDSLQKLYIGYTDLIDAGLMCFLYKNDLPNLKTLCLRGTRVTDSGVKQILTESVSHMDILWAPFKAARKDKCHHYQTSESDPLSSCHIEFV